MPFSDSSPVHNRLCQRILLVFGLCLVLAGCDSDLRTDTTLDNDGPITSPPSIPPTGSSGVTSNDQLSLQVGNGEITLEEGA